MKSKHPINVEVSPKYSDEPLERMIRRFVKKVKKQKILEQVREKQQYDKPSVKRRKAEIERQKVLRKLRSARERKNKLSR